MAPKEEEEGKIQALKEALYRETQENGSENRPFTQQDLLDLGVIPNNDPLLLLKVIQQLTHERLFVAVSTSNSELAWRWRNEDDARKSVAKPPYTAKSTSLTCCLSLQISLPPERGDRNGLRRHRRSRRRRNLEPYD